MKIILYSDSVEIGGAENYLRWLAIGLKDKGHEIIVYFPHLPNTSKYFKELESSGIAIRPATRNMRDLKSQLESERPDIIHFNLPDAFSCSKEIELARKVDGVKLIATIHSLSRIPAVKTNSEIKAWIATNIPFWRVIDSLRGNLAIWLRRTNIQKRLSNLSRIIAVSEASKKELISTFGLPSDKIAVIYNGIPIKEYADNREARKILGFDLDTPLIACIGRLVKNKGQDIFLKAAALIKRNMPETKYLIVGDGYLKDSLQKLSRQLGLSKEVIFLEYDKVPWVFGAMDVSVVPSLSETFSFTVAESMAAGKPVVASQVGGIPELLDQRNGLLVKALDPISLADAIIKILVDHDLKGSLGQMGRKRIIEHFNGNTTILETEKLYAG